MSYFLQIGATGGPTQIASNGGYGNWGRWIDKLDAEKYPAAIHLYEYGWCQDLADLESQLDKAVKDESPPADVADIVESMVELLKGREADASCCTVTDGIGGGANPAKSVDPTIRARLKTAGYSDAEIVEYLIKLPDHTDADL